ncbi:MAG: hypothetical protein M3Z21_09240 [Pseudomonadota bacterium]|nr:hypothetical protein [Pseudomonadota bacterium]
MVAREGRIPLAFAVVLALAATARFEWAGLPLWLAAVLLLFLFREPRRSVPARPLALVSPVDGRVVSIASRLAPQLRQEMIGIRIQAGPLGPFTVRSPTEGRILSAPDHAWAADNRPRVVAWVQTDEKDDVLLTLTPRLAKLAPSFYFPLGSRVGQGQRCGFLPLGGSAEVLVPLSSRLKVQPGDTVRAGADIIALLVHG